MLDSDLRVGVGKRERKKSEGSGDTSENAVSALAFAIKNDQTSAAIFSDLLV